jgi:hypothetical protein
VVNARPVVRLVFFGALMLIAGGVLAQVRGWPPFYPRGRNVALENISAQAQDAIPATSLDIFNDFGYVGPPKTQWVDADSSRGDSCVFYLGAGNSGVVRSVWMSGTGWNTLDSLCNYELRIYVGAGDIVNKSNPPAEHLCATLPMSTLLGVEYKRAGTDTVVSTRMMDYTLLSPLGTVALQLHLPIPFENGIAIQVWNNAWNAIVPGVAEDSEHGDLARVIADFSWVGYETGVSTSPYQHWRLRSASLLRHVVTAADTATDFMNVASGAGKMVAWFVSVKDSSTIAAGDGAPNWAEGNWRIYPDGAVGSPWETSGAEDLFGTNAYWYTLKERLTPNWGTTHFEKNGRFTEGYRMFYGDPVVWNNGVRCALQQNATNPKPYVLNITALYYSIPGALVP